MKEKLHSLLEEFLDRNTSVFEFLRVRETGISPEDKDLLWERITETIQAKEKNKLAFSSKTLLRIAASVILIIGLTFWSVDRLARKDKQVNYRELIGKLPDLTNSQHIQLILPNQKTIDIKEKTATFIHDKTGNVKVNAEEINVEESQTKTNPKEEAQFNQIVVPNGKTSEITLTDGTQIWINSGSRLIYPVHFSDKKREIFVEGEIYLKVAKNEELPFVVKTNDMDITVLGTCFNVSAYKNEEKQSVVLVSGSVKVSNSANQPVYISPNEEYSYKKNTGQYSIQNVDVFDRICWRYGFLNFKKEKLSNVLQKLTRYYAIHIDFEENQLEKITVSGKLNLKDDMDEVFQSIALTAPIKYKINKSHNNIQVELKK